MQIRAYPTLFQQTFPAHRISDRTHVNIIICHSSPSHPALYYHSMHRQHQGNKNHLDEPANMGYHINRKKRLRTAHAFRKGEDTMSEEYGNSLVSVLDDEGNEHQFELLDAIETDEGRYVALLPVYTEAELALEDDGELVILEVVNDEGDDLLVPIEDDEVFANIAEIFEERLEDLYEINELDEPETLS
ncbi:MAG: DUF1292 domain-containing protein [Ruminococcaceae bacterium]|nr:DUF1292 domain-containing protein [Oscillospiraceae bacterium]